MSHNIKTTQLRIQTPATHTKRSNLEIVLGLWDLQGLGLPPTDGITNNMV